MNQMSKFDQIVRVPKQSKGELPEEEYQKIVELYKSMDQDTLQHIVHLYNEDVNVMDNIEETYHNSIRTFGFFAGMNKYIDDSAEIDENPNLQDMAQHFVRKQDIVHNISPLKWLNEPKQRSKTLNELLRNLKK